MLKNEGKARRLQHNERDLTVLAIMLMNEKSSLIHVAILQTKTKKSTKVRKKKEKKKKKEIVLRNMLKPNYIFICVHVFILMLGSGLVQ